MIGHRARFRENDDLPTWRGPAAKKKPPFLKDPLHKWRLNLNNSTYSSLASHSREKSFVLKYQYEAKD